MSFLPAAAQTSTIASQVELASLEGIASPTEQHASGLQSWQKAALMLPFCFAQFLSSAMIFAIFLATPAISAAVGLSPREVLWVVGSYSINYTSFLLPAGKLATVCNPVPIFLVSFVLLGCIAVGQSFWSSGEKFGFLILNGLAGIAAALLQPTAVRIIIYLYPDDASQKRALALFNLSAPLGQSLGGLIAGILLLGSWRWVFRAVAIAILVQALGACWLLRRMRPLAIYTLAPGESRWKALDPVGVFSLVASIYLPVAALFNGTAVGWGSREFIIPLVVAVVPIALFVLWEWRRDGHNTIFPRRVLQVPNFAPLSILLLGPLSWWGAPAAPLSSWFQVVLRQTPLSTGLHLVPMGVTAIVLALCMTTVIPQLLRHPRIVVPSGIILGIGGLLLISFAEGRVYWRLAFPGYILYSAGIMVAFLPSSIALVQSCSVGFVGFSGSLVGFLPQLGAIVGATIQIAIAQSTGPLDDWTSTQNSLWFVLAWMAAAGAFFAFCFDQVKATAACRSAEGLAPSQLAEPAT